MVNVKKNAMIDPSMWGWSIWGIFLSMQVVAVNNAIYCDDKTKSKLDCIQEQQRFNTHNQIYKNRQINNKLVGKNSSSIGTRLSCRQSRCHSKRQFCR